MRKALIIYRVDRSEASNIGIIKKLIGQIEGLKHLGMISDFIIHDDQHIYLNQSVIYKRSNRGINLLFKISFFDILDQLNLELYDLYIIRYGLTTPSFLRWLRNIKNGNPESRVLIDIPTFPYNSEWKGIFGKLALFIDKMLSKKLNRQVNFVVHSGKEAEIFGIKTIRITNGIQLEEVFLRTPLAHSGYKLIAVGKWAYWHGLDRLIKGLGNYIQEGHHDVTLDIIGEGPASDQLNQLVKKCGLTDYIQFKGICTGEKLNGLFDQADLGIGTLGLHRKNVLTDCSLKHREYTARGLPFILASTDGDALDQQKFTYKVPSDETDIPINDLILFAKRCTNMDVAREMRNYAEKHLSWKVKMSDLISQLERS